MRLFIRYDAEGNILSAMKAAHLHGVPEHPYGDPDEGGGVLEVEADGPLADLECHEIHDLYRVDVKKKELKKKPGRRGRG